PDGRDRARPRSLGHPVLRAGRRWLQGRAERRALRALARAGRLPALLPDAFRLRHAPARTLGGRPPRPRRGPAHPAPALPVAALPVHDGLAGVPDRAPIGAAAVLGGRGRRPPPP